MTVSKFPSQMTPRESGRRGYEAGLALRSRAQRVRDARKGGRRPNRSLDEILAEKAANEALKKSRSVRTRGGRRMVEPATLPA